VGLPGLGVGFGVCVGDSLLEYLAVPMNGGGVVTCLNTDTRMWGRRRRRGVRDNMFCFASAFPSVVGSTIL